jgi:hypothetical protein
MGSTTGEHIDELEARRQKRQTRRAAPDSPGKPLGGPASAGAARDLLRDLITSGSRQSEDASGSPGESGSAADVVQPAIAPQPSDAHRPTAPRGGEGVDELVRRVQAGTQAAGASATAPRRPIGTADLSADAAARTSPGRGPGKDTAERPTSPAGLTAVVSWARSRWAITAAICVVAAAAAGALALAPGGAARHPAAHSMPRGPGAKGVTAVRPGQVTEAARARAASAMTAERQAAAADARHHRQQLAARRLRQHRAARQATARRAARTGASLVGTSAAVHPQRSSASIANSASSQPPAGTGSTGQPTSGADTAPAAPATSGTGSTSQSTNSTGGSSAAPGLTGIGTVSGGCNPKCS